MLTCRVKAATPDGLGPHAAVVTGTTAAAYETAMAYIRPAGTVVAVGLPSREATIAANVAMTVLQKKRLVGSMVGTRLDVIEALRIVAEGHVKVTIQIRPFDELQKTYDEIIAGTLPGRVVLDREYGEWVELTYSVQVGSEGRVRREWQVHVLVLPVTMQKLVGQRSIMRTGTYVDTRQPEDGDVGTDGDGPSPGMRGQQ